MSITPWEELRRMQEYMGRSLRNLFNDTRVLEFWLDASSEKLEELANIETKDLSSGEVTQYSVEFIPEETGYARADYSPCSHGDVPWFTSSLSSLG